MNWELKQSLLMSCSNTTNARHNQKSGRGPSISLALNTRDPRVTRPLHPAGKRARFHIDLRCLLVFTLVPECRFNTKFVVGLDGNADVVTQHFAKQFVKLGHLGATTNALPELHLDHRIRALAVTALMVAAIE